jgi:2'-5' RNA ligase
MIRTFVGIGLNGDLRSSLAVQLFLLPLPKREPVENLHLTLVFLGEIEDCAIEAAHEAFSILRLNRISISLSGLGMFGGERPRLVYAAVTPSEPLLHLQRKVETAARGTGIKVEARRFVPHVTLGRFRPPGREVAMRIERAVVEQGAFRAGPVEVREFTLFRSQRSSFGSRYDVLATYPLR